MEQCGNFIDPPRSFYTDGTVRKFVEGVAPWQSQQQGVKRTMLLCCCCCCCCCLLLLLLLFVLLFHGECVLGVPYTFLLFIVHCSFIHLFIYSLLLYLYCSAHSSPLPPQVSAIQKHPWLQLKAAGNDELARVLCSNNKQQAEQGFKLIPLGSSECG